MGSRDLLDICAFERPEGFVWFSSWLDIFSLFARAASGLCPRPSAFQVLGIRVGATTPDQDIETQQTPNLGGWLEGCHGDVSTKRA